MIEVDEVLPEVFERKEVIRGNGKNLSQTKPKDISESLLYPELSDQRLGLPVRCGARVERSELCEQRLGRKLGANVVPFEELESKHGLRTRSATYRCPCGNHVEVVTGGFVLRPESVTRLLIVGRVGDAVPEPVILIEVGLQFKPEFQQPVDTW